MLEFDGTDDALMHPFDQAGNRHMEYIRQRGSFDDLPLDQIQADFREFYPGWFDADVDAAAHRRGRSRRIGRRLRLNRTLTGAAAIVAGQTVLTQSTSQGA